MRLSLLLLASIIGVSSSSSFEPYQLNGGLVAAVAGRDYLLIASDTRLTDGGYQIYSRNYTQRIRSLSSPSSSGENNNIFLASAGCEADCTALSRNIKYQLQQKKARGWFIKPDTGNIAHLLQQTLYARRTFPYYSFNVLGGLSSDEEAQVWVYDAIGSMEQVAVGTAGNGREVLQPILDTMLSSTTQRQTIVENSLADAIDVLIHAYHAVAEREISVGDSLLLYIVERNNKAANQQADGGVTIKCSPTTCRIIQLPLKEH